MTLNPLKKKLLVIGSIAGVVTTGVVTAIAVSISNANKNKPKYDMGIIVPSVNSLNYVKYASSRNVVGSTIPSMFVTRPEKTDKVSSLLMKDPTTVLTFDAEYPVGYESNTFYTESFDSYYLKDFQVSDNLKGNMTINAEINMNGQQFKGEGYKGVSMMVDTDVRWSDNKRLRASDFINYVNMVMDQNSTSDLLTELEDAGIAGVEEFIAAQKSYFSAHNEIYLTPNGINHPGADGKTQLSWPSQTAGDAADVKKIEEAYKGVEIYGDEFSARPFTLASKDTSFSKYLAFSPLNLSVDRKPGLNISKPKDFVENMQWLYKRTYAQADIKDSFLSVQFKRSYRVNKELIKAFTQTNILMPINMDAVRKQGGINKFGNKTEGMPYIGAYKFSDGVLGKNGSLILQKNDDFLYKADVFAKSIKLYFSEDPNVNYAMFKDGMVAKTTLPSIQVSNAFSNLSIRPFLRKKSNSSTEGLTFNLDPSTRNVDKDHDPLQYPSFRKAVFYAIDREQALKILQQDSSLVKSNFSSTITLMDDIGNWTSGLMSIDERGQTDIKPNGPTEWLDSIYRDASGNLEPTVNTEIQPIQGDSSITSVLKQYDLMHRYSSDFIFEGAPRKDRVTNRVLARKFLELFKQEWKAKTHQDFTNYKIEYIFGNQADGENLGISLQNQIKDTFGDQVSVEIKGFSAEIYSSYVEQGKFDITYKELAGVSVISDVYNPMLFIKKFLVHDSVAKGYLYYNNPTGGWTFDDFLSRFPAGSAEETDLINRLHLHKTDLSVIRELVKFTPYEQSLKTSESLIAAEKERLERMKAWFLGDKYSQNNIDITYPESAIPAAYAGIKAMRFNILAQFDKFVLEDCPVVPITIGGQGWELSRLKGAMTHGSVMQFELAFDKTNPPKDELKRVI